jgi:hypothetical protein
LIDHILQDRVKLRHTILRPQDQHRQVNRDLQPIWCRRLRGQQGLLRLIKARLKRLRWQGQGQPQGMPRQSSVHIRAQCDRSPGEGLDALEVNSSSSDIMDEHPPAPRHGGP